MNVLVLRAFLDELEKLGASASQMLGTLAAKRGIGNLPAIKQLGWMEKVPEMRSRAAQLAMSTRQALKAPSVATEAVVPRFARSLPSVGSV